MINLTWAILQKCCCAKEANASDGLCPLAFFFVMANNWLNWSHQVINHQLSSLRETIVPVILSGKPSMVSYFPRTKSNSFVWTISSDNFCFLPSIKHQMGQLLKVGSSCTFLLPCLCSFNSIHMDDLPTH